MADTVMLKMRGCGASYGASRALHDISLDITAGQTTAILGVNGAGKTTTLNMIAGLIAPDVGEMWFEGTPVFKRTKIIREGVALAPEGRRLFAHMTVADNLLAGAHVRRDRAEVARDLEQVYTMFPRLRERLWQKAGTLSGGEQQMAAIGRALMRRPRLLLLDEPTLGLAPRMVDVVGDIIAEIAKTGLTIVLVEQSTTVALRVASYVYVLAHGRVTTHGPTEKFRANDQLVKSYLGGSSDAPSREGVHHYSLQ